ncbi:MAG: hypothetical protein V8S92_00005, partial [Oscillospiraceae bacterium]
MAVGGVIVPPQERGAQDDRLHDARADSGGRCAGHQDEARGGGQTQRGGERMVAAAQQQDHPQ